MYMHTGAAANERRLIDGGPLITLPVLQDHAVVDEADVAGGGGRGGAQFPDQVQDLWI